MGQDASVNRGRAWGDKEHVHTDAGHINRLVNKQKWPELVELVGTFPEGAAVADKLQQGMLPIHRALLKGASTQLIEKLVEAYPAGLLCAEDNCMLPLHYACAYGHCTEKGYMKLHNPLIADSHGHVLKLLLKTQPMAAKEIDQEGRTPLHVAASSKACALAVVDLLEAHEAASARRTKLGKLPIHFALEFRACTDTVKALLTAHPNAVGESAQRKCPLHYAVEGHAAPETVRYLAEAYPAGVREKSIESMLPLHLACAHKQPLEVIQLLTEAHPDGLYDRDRHSRMPLHHALESAAAEDVLLYLLEQAPDTAKVNGYYPHLPLHIAVEKQCALPVLQALLSKHPGSAADRDMYGVLPLRRTLKNKGEEDVVLCILADAPEAAGDLDEYDRLALHYACGRRMSKQVVSALLDSCPSSVSVPDKNGQLPLHLAVMRSAERDVLELLIEKFPAAVLVPDNFNYLPLHHAIELDALPYVYDVLIKADPGCATIRMDGKPPLHFAVEMRRSLPTLKMLLDAYPGVAAEKETEKGRLPLCWAMERELPIETLLLLEQYYPAERAALEEDLTGRLPIHYCVEYDAPVEMARMLLKANPLVATQRELPFYYYEAPVFMDVDTTSYVTHGKSAVHVEEERLAVEAKAAAREQAAALKASRDACAARAKAIKRSNAEARISNVEFALGKAGDEPLDQGPRPGAKEAAGNGNDNDNEDGYANNIQSGAKVVVKPEWRKPPKPEVTSGPVSVRQKRNNHGDVSDAMVPNKESLKTAWDEQYQRSRPLLHRPGKMLIHYATEDMHANAQTVAEILLLTMPISVESGAVNTYHGYGWTYLLSDTQDKYVDAVNVILDRYSVSMNYMQLLCDTPTETGIMAGQVATPRCLAAIMARLHYFSRYQVQQGGVAHESDNSVVRLAIDHSHLFEGPVTEKKCEEKKVVKVAIKFMRHRVQYDREVTLRSSVAFDERYVVPLLASHDGDADPAYKAETVKKGVAQYPYLITMVQAERDLLSAIQHEHFAGRDFELVKLYARQILEALVHLHAAGILHGDIKPLNVVRSGGRFKLIDLGSAVRFGNFAGTSKMSTAYLPPEMVFKKVAAFAGKLEVAPNEEKTKYFSTHERQDYALSSKTGLAVFAEEHKEGSVDKEPTAADYSAPGERPRKPASETPCVDPMPAVPAMDMWSFGVLLYLMATGENLFMSDISDDIDKKQLEDVLEPFPDAFKSQRLGKCDDHWTRNLMFQCLSRDPRRRPLPSEALLHPYFTGVSDDIADNYRMPGQPCKFDVCICYSTAAHSAYRRSVRRKHFVNNRDADFAEKERIDAEEVAHLQAEHLKSKHSFLQVEFKPSSPDWVEPVEPEYIDCDHEEEAKLLTERLAAKGYKVTCCEGGKSLMNSHCAIIILSRNCCNNDEHPQQKFLNLTAESDFDPYFFEIRLALEMREQSYLEGGVISLPVGDKEQGEAKMARLMAEKATRDRANAISEERERARNLALDKKNKRAEAAERSRQKKQAAIRGGGGGKAKSPSKSQSLESNGSSLSPSRESKDEASVGSRASTKGGGVESNAKGKGGANAPQEKEDSNDDDGEKAHNKFWNDEEAIKNQSMEMSYLPYYATFENELIGKYGGSHPAGHMCLEPVKTVEVEVVNFLKKYFLGKVPIINDAECSPAKLMMRVTKAKQVVLMGERERAWKSSTQEIHSFLSGESPQDAAVDAAGDDEEDDEAKLHAIAKFLRMQMQLKNGEIELLEKEVEAAVRTMQDRKDELQSLRKRFSIF